MCALELDLCWACCDIQDVYDCCDYGSVYVHNQQSYTKYVYDLRDIYQMVICNALHDERLSDLLCPLISASELVKPTSTTGRRAVIHSWAWERGC